MPKFCVNRVAQSNGDHEVHDTTTMRPCHPSAANQIDLGYHDSCHSAVRAAKAYYSTADGCAHCATACHSR